MKKKTIKKDPEFQTKVDVLTKSIEGIDKDFLAKKITKLIRELIEGGCHMTCIPTPIVENTSDGVIVNITCTCNKTPIHG